MFRMKYLIYAYHKHDNSCTLIDGKDSLDEAIELAEAVKRKLNWECIITEQRQLTNIKESPNE